MRIPRGVLIGIGVLPIAGLFALMVWAVARPNAGNPGGLAVYDSSGEVKIAQRDAFKFELALFNGQRFALADAIGKPVMVDFWASWCVPCRIEAPAVERVWQRYKGKVLFVGVDLWDQEQSGRDFVRQFGITYPVGPDPKGEAGVEYGVTGIPEKFFIDSQGKIVRKFVGPMDEERLSRVLDELIAASR